MVSITRSRIDINKLIELVLAPASGAVDVFIGTTRNHANGKEVLALEYEAYEPMALRELEALESRAQRQWPVHRIVIIHRIGKVPIGEVSVAIAVSSSHRKDAFEACRYLIDELKKSVPIWKREYFADGTIEWAGSGSQAPEAHHLTAT